MNVRHVCTNELSERDSFYGREISHEELDSRIERICQEEFERCQTNAIGQACKVEFDKHNESRELEE